MIYYVRKTIKSPRRVVCHFVEITQPVRVYLNAERKAYRPGEFCRKHSLDIAINTNFFEKDLRPIGLYQSGKERLANPADGQWSLCFHDAVDGGVILLPSVEAAALPLDPAGAIVSGYPIVLDGQVKTSSEQRFNLTLMGLTASKTLVLCVIESNPWGSPGLTIREAAEYLLEMGIVWAVHMDCGSSTLLGTNIRLLNCPSTRILKQRLTVPWINPVPTLIGFEQP